jgi:hypothetical protein
MADVANATVSSQQATGTGWFSGLSKWGRLAVGLVLVLLLGFVLRLVLSNQSLVGSVHQRNFHNLDVAARGLEEWPESIRQVANSSLLLPARSGNRFSRYHPDIGDYDIEYSAPPNGGGTCPRAPKTFEMSDKAGFGMAYNVAGELVPDASPGAGKPESAGGPVPQRRCFRTSVPLDRLVNLREAAPDFTHLLILASDGSVIAQLGASPLPINRLQEFASPGDLTSTVVRSVVAPKAVTTEPTTISIEKVGTIVDKTIAGTSYTIYIKPFVVRSQIDACRPPQAKVAVGGAAEGGDGFCYAVGLMPSARLRSAWLSPAPLTIVGFGLALVALVGTLPLLRLLMIGATESLGPAETAGAIIGMQVAAAIATLAILTVGETISERNSAEQVLSEQAVGLARNGDQEIDRALAWAAVLDQPRSRVGCKRLIGPPFVTRQCWEAFSARDRLPGSLLDFPVQSMHYISDAGVTIPTGTTETYPVIAFQDKLPTGINVRSREYFADITGNRARAWNSAEAVQSAIGGGAAQGTCQPFGADGTLRYAVGQVRAQTDAISKTVLAVECHSAQSGSTPQEAALVGKKRSFYLLVATTLKSFMAPVLPDPVKFMVVDLRAPGLPVLFHDNRFREGNELFAERVQGGGSGLAALRGLRNAARSETRAPLELQLRYDGKVTQFMAMPMVNADWAVLAYYVRDDADLIPATTATTALFGWLSLAMIGFVIGAIRLFASPQRWRDLWPDEAEHQDYRSFARTLTVAAGLVLAVMLLALAGVVPLTLGFFSAMALWVGSTAYFNLVLTIKPRSAKPLSPVTERNYVRMVMAMALCVAVVPMIALWADARVLSRELADTRRYHAAISDLIAHQDRRAGVDRTLGDARQQFNLTDITRQLPGEGVIPRLPSRSANFARILWETQFVAPALPALICPPDARHLGWLCFDSAIAQVDRTTVADHIGIAPHQTRWQLSWLSLAALLALAALLGTLVFKLVERGLSALMGFGVPLGAIRLKQFNLRGLAPRTLLVAPQQPVKHYLHNTGDPWTLDLADILLTTREVDLNDQATKIRFEQLLYEETRRHGGPPDRMVVSGLSLILRDPDRRRAALKFLETAERWLELRMQQLNLVDHQADAESGQLIEPDAKEPRVVGIVMISEFSPLERILDAFDSEDLEGQTAHRSREELRWARFFQRFATYTFAPIEKIDMRDPRIDRLKPQYSSLLALVGRWIARSRPRLRSVARFKRRSPFAQAAVSYAAQRFSTRAQDNAAYVLIDELRWLPGSIIDSLLPPESVSHLRAEDGQVPIKAAIYQQHYTERVLNWATAVEAPSEEAAIDYLRSTLIEHYEQCWAASTFSERLVLDAIARGSFVNVRVAFAMQSLVRRGLVILDPAPRLMNRSFAAFVTLAERPDTLRDWRKRQPRSNWSVARFPIMAVIPVGAIVLAAGAAQSGQQVTALFSLLVAGGPALFTALMRTVRAGG